MKDLSCFLKLSLVSDLCLPFISSNMNLLAEYENVPTHLHRLLYAQDYPISGGLKLHLNATSTFLYFLTDPKMSPMKQNLTRRSIP